MNQADEILALKQKQCYTFEDLLAVTRILRSENGCPWIVSRITTASARS